MRWEYRQCRPEHGSWGVFDVVDLNLLGAEGWELVSTYEDAEGVTHALFKRPLPSTLNGGGE